MYRIQTIERKVFSPENLPGQGIVAVPKAYFAKVGNSGNCYTSGHKLTPDERAKQLGAHLHLSVFKEKQIKDIYNDKEDSYTYSEKLVNPFNRNHRFDTDGDL